MTLVPASFEIINSGINESDKNTEESKTEPERTYYKVYEQVGIYGVKENMERKVKEIEARGLSAFVEEYVK